MLNRNIGRSTIKRSALPGVPSFRYSVIWVIPAAATVKIVMIDVSEEFRDNCA